MKLNPSVERALNLLRDPVLRAAFNSAPTVTGEDVDRLADQIDAYENADPPASPPAALLKSYQEAKERYCAEQRARRGTPRINLISVKPIKEVDVGVFVDMPGFHGPGIGYPKSDEGQAMQELRRSIGQSFATVARALCVGAEDVSGLERGSVTTDAAGWSTILTTLFLLGSGMDAGHIADPFTSPEFLRLVGEPSP